MTSGDTVNRDMAYNKKSLGDFPRVFCYSALFESEGLIIAYFSYE